MAAQGAAHLLTSSAPPTGTQPHPEVRLTVGLLEAGKGTNGSKWPLVAGTSLGDRILTLPPPKKKDDTQLGVEIPKNPS